jgi:hypothetical protein
LTYEYLATSASTSWQTATVTLNGTNYVDGVSAYRIGKAYYSTGSGTTFNLGTITGRHKVTTANIFFQMTIGYSRTQVAAYTVPAGCTAFITRVHSELYSSTSTSVQGCIYTRALNGSPQLMRPFNVSNNANHNDEVVLKIPAGTDIMIRLTESTSAAATIVTGGFDIIEYNSVV